jgi:hypothetical protein
MKNLFYFFAIIVIATASTARAQIFVAHDGIIDEYTTSGDLVNVNGPLVTGLNTGGYQNYAPGIAVSGSNIYVANYAGTISE